MAKNHNFKIRPAKKEDAKGILEAHYSAVHETASNEYPPDVLAEWATVVDQTRIEKYLNQSFTEETTLVAELEKIAKAKGCVELQMASSITAEPFYLRCGYQVIERGLHALSSGKQMASVKMRKKL